MQKVDTSKRGLDVRFGSKNWAVYIKVGLAFYSFAMTLMITRQWKIQFFEDSTWLIFVLGICIAISSFLMTKWLDPLIGSAMKLAEITGMTILGEIDSVFDWLNIDYIRERLLISIAESNNEHCVIVCSSFQTGEGKSITVASLAKSFSRINRKVLLIEADLWCAQPNQFVPSSKRNNTAGLSDFIVDNVPLRDCIYYPPEESFSVMTRGQKIDDPVGVLSSPKLLGLLSWAQLENTVVLIEAPTIMNFNEMPRLLMDQGVLLLSVSNFNNFSSISKIMSSLKKTSLKDRTALVLTKQY